MSRRADGDCSGPAVERPTGVTDAIISVLRARECRIRMSTGPLFTRGHRFDHNNRLGNHEKPPAN
jgi:hypothetical protein